jgi:hypothetical protein
MYATAIQNIKMSLSLSLSWKSWDTSIGGLFLIDEVFGEGYGITLGRQQH